MKIDDFKVICIGRDEHGGVFPSILEDSNGRWWRETSCLPPNIKGKKEMIDTNGRGFSSGELEYILE